MKKFILFAAVTMGFTTHSWGATILKCVGSNGLKIVVQNQAPGVGSVLIKPQSGKILSFPAKISEYEGKPGTRTFGFHNYNVTFGDQDQYSLWAGFDASFPQGAAGVSLPDGEKVGLTCQQIMPVTNHLDASAAGDFCCHHSCRIIPPQCP